MPLIADQGIDVPQASRQTPFLAIEGFPLTFEVLN
jgi:hypothetical protein